jgi:hypothetical protein
MGRLDEIVKAVGAAAPKPKYIRAYHGSPHDFDRFDASHLGKGQGAASYGQGLYFAEEPKVAADYRAQLAGSTPLDEVVIAGRRVSPSNRWNYSPRNDSVEENVLSTLLENVLLDEHGLRAAGPNARDFVVDTLRARSKHYADEWPEAVPAAAALEKKIMQPEGVRVSFGQQPGKTYEVEIQRSPEEFLDWDAPVSEQPRHVVQALEKIDPRRWGYVPERAGATQYHGLQWRSPAGGYLGDHVFDKLPDQMTFWDSLATKPGREGFLAYYNLADFMPPRRTPAMSMDDLIVQHPNYQTMREVAASRLLAEQGVPGIRYLDSGSRTAGDGTRNYVVFPGAEDSIRILRKFGLAAPIAAGAMQDQQ